MGNFRNDGWLDMECPEYAMSFQWFLKLQILFVLHLDQYIQQKVQAVQQNEQTIEQKHQMTACGQCNGRKPSLVSATSVTHSLVTFDVTAFSPSYFSIQCIHV